MSLRNIKTSTTMRVASSPWCQPIGYPNLNWAIGPTLHMYDCMYECMHVGMNVCISLYMCVFMHACMHISKSKNQIKNILFPPDCDINEHKLLPVAPTVTRSLTASATASLVHAFVVNRLDYCSSLYAGLPACRLACLDRVLRSAVRLIGGIPKFGHVSKYMLDVLHLLPAEQRISYRIASIVWRCLLGLAPLYLRELCCPLHSAMSSRSLRLSQQGLLLVPFACTSAKQSRAFSVVGPSIWNGLHSQLRTLPRALSPTCFAQLKTALFSRAGVGSASE